MPNRNPPERAVAFCTGSSSGVAIAKVRELCEELLGPPQSRGEGAAGVECVAHAVQVVVCARQVGAAVREQPHDVEVAHRRRLLHRRVTCEERALVPSALCVRVVCPHPTR